MAVVGPTLGIVHLHIAQALLRLGQSGRGRVVTYVAVLEVVEPFLQGRRGHLVELVDADDVIFGEDVLRRDHADGVLRPRVDDQPVLGVHADELVLTVVEVVRTLAQVEVDDADGVDLLHLVVLVAQPDVLRDGLRHAVEDALQVVQLARLLDLDEDDLALRVARLDVHAVELVVGRLLVALALEQLHDGHLLVEQHRHQSLQHGVVSLVAQHALGCPVKSDILFHTPVLFIYSPVLQSYEKKSEPPSLSDCFF